MATSLRRIFFVAIALALLWHGPERVALAQNPTTAPTAPDGMPVLRLPWPGGVTYRVTCGYGCYQHRGTMSYAVDVAVPTDAPIVAAGDGVVLAITWETGLPANLHLGDALIVYIDHGDGWKTRYIHLSGITVRVGDEVKAGQIIGYGGSTGASAAHLHFELKRGNNLHSLSYRIDHLFGGQPPEAGARYTSDNYYYPNGTPSAAPAAPAAPAAAAPPSAPAAAPPVPTAESGLNAQAAGLAALGSSPDLPPALSAPMPTATPVPPPPSGVGLSKPLAVYPVSVTAGQRITTTFTIHNQRSEKVTFPLLGVGGRSPDGELQARTLFFQRNVTIPAGGSYTFTGTRAIDLAGDVVLFPFALDPNGALLRLVADAKEAPMIQELAAEILLTVKPPLYRLFLPLIRRAEITTVPAGPTPGATRTGVSSPTAVPPLRQGSAVTP